MPHSDEVGNKKSSWDARKGYTDTLINLITSTINSNLMGELEEWENYMWNYFTLTKLFIPHDKYQKILILKKKISELKRPKGAVSADFFANKRYQQLAGSYLMQLQEELFGSTMHLLMPINDTDDDDDFNPEDAVGKK